MEKIQNKKYIILILLFSIMLFGLISLFPQLHDDLLHGTFGLSFNFMPDVNGRYLGNLFGIIITNSYVLRIIIKGIFIIMIFLLINKITDEKNKFLVLISIFLFLFIPKSIFRETIVFSSGYGNYIIPIAGILFIIYHGFNKKNSKYKPYHCIFFFLLGIFNSLFVEHVTLFNLILSIYFLVSTYLENKKINYMFLLYFIGSIVGLIIMFSNPIYIASFAGEDSYRSMSQLSDIITKFGQIVYGAFHTNYIINFCIIILISVLYKNIFSIKGKTLEKIMCFLIWMFGTYSLLKIIYPNWFILLRYTIYFECFITIIFLCSVIYLILKSDLNKKDINKLLFFIISSGLILGPLLLVNPIGPRCYLGTYIFLMLFVVELFKILVDKKKINLTIIQNLLPIIIFIQFIFYFNIYGYIYIKNNQRINFINSQISSGSKDITIKSLPYPDFLHGPELCSEYSEYVFRKYYKIDSSVKLEKEGC